MLKKFIFSYVAFFSTAFSCTVTDDAGRKITLLKPATRIISLAPDLTEDLYAIGAGEQIIGVVKGSDYPIAALKKPIVAHYNHLYAETILAMKPDLIVTWSKSFNTELFVRANIPVYVSDPKKISDIPKTFERLACLTGRDASKEIKRWQKEMPLQKNKTKLTVFYQLWHMPLLTITKSSWIDQAITLCAGKNIFADLYGSAPEVAKEAVIRKNPAMIIAASKNDDWKNAWQTWPEMRAVQHHALYTINPDWIERPGPRLLNGIHQLCAAIENARKDSNA